MYLWALREDWQHGRPSTRQYGHEGDTDSANRLRLPVAARSEFDPRLMEVGKVPQHPLTPPLTARWGWQRYRNPPLDCKQGRQGGRAEQVQEQPRSHRLLLFSQNVV